MANIPMAKPIATGKNRRRLDLWVVFVVRWLCAETVWLTPSP
jgi:hypothetical protein